MNFTFNKELFLKKNPIVIVYVPPNETHLSSKISNEKWICYCRRVAEELEKSQYYDSMIFYNDCGERPIQTWVERPQVMTNRETINHTHSHIPPWFRKEQLLHSLPK